jgi:D-alanyl-D-alanine carboxypeptidase
VPIVNPIQNTAATRQLVAALVIAGLSTSAVGCRGRDRAAADERARAIESLLSGVYKADGPGAAVIVVKDGLTIVRKAYGMASVELQVPMRPEMAFPLASITKQFTAAAILMLAEQGKLSLADPITTFLPTHPARGPAITIEHLLTHTSGISSLADLDDLRAADSQDARVTDVINDWVKDLPPDSAPGEKFAYLNWGYSLLGAIVEQASGQTYDEFLRQHVFGPLGMTHTAYNDRSHIVPLRVAGYALIDTQVVNALPNRSRVLHPRGAGGLVSTVDDLARWNQALSSEVLLKKASLDRMFTSYRLADGTSTLYGYGWNVGEFDGHRVQEHTGGTPGFLAHVLRMPDDGVYVAILSNRFSFSPPPQATAHRIAALAIGRPVADPLPVAVTSASLGELPGTYKVAGATSYTVTRSGDRLFVQLPGFPRMELLTLAPLEFRTANVTWRFSFGKDADARIARLRVRDWTLDDTAERVSEAAPSPTVLKRIGPTILRAYAGTYELVTGVLITVRRERDHLVAQVTGQRGVEIFPVTRTEFAAEGSGPGYSFVRDAAGRVTGLLVGQGERPLPARRIR